MSEIKQIKELIEQIIQVEIKYKMEKLIVALSDKFNLDRNEIYNCLKEFDVQLEQNNTGEIPINVEINEDKCLGKTKYFTQCSRSRQADSLFCGSHLTKLPYGRIDIPNSDKTNGKKRGRPRKDKDDKDTDSNKHVDSD